jgi:hypothetical protein
MAILKKTLFCTVICLLAACATYSKQQVDSQLAEFKGLTLQQLIALWGVPNRQFAANGQQFVEWVKQESSNARSSVSIGSGTGGRNSFFGIGVSIPIESEPDTCQLTATTDETKSQVLHLQWQGDQNFCGTFLQQTTKVEPNSANN